MELTADILKQMIGRIPDDTIDEYEIIGIRVDDVPYDIGAELPNSYGFTGRNIDEARDQHPDTITSLGGTCAFLIYRDGELDSHSARSILGTYFDDQHVHIIAGDLIEWGQDPGEVIIGNAVVISKTNKEEENGN